MAEPSTDKRPLDEVMLAMDVVDTLRHRQVLVERELHADDREQKLIDRLRQIYASQGMEVPDHVLAEGVAALEEERFVYKPPGGGLSVALARMYVERGKWFMRTGIVAIVLAVLGVGYHFVFVAPAERQLEQQVTELNRETRGAADKLDALEQDVNRLERASPQSTEGLPGAFADTAKAQREALAQSLNEARGLIGAARESAPRAGIEVDTYEEQADTVKTSLERQRVLIDRAAYQIERAEASVLATSSLMDLPPMLAAQRDAVLAVAEVDEAATRAKQQYEGGMAALRAGDVERAEASLAALASLQQQLEQEYILRVVSRPNEYSGVWRIPERNPNARNYYVVVEAVTADGRVLTVPITNEEDGNVVNVSKWALRVEERVFQRIAADKQDDGIIQNRRFGLKRRGHLDPEYLMPTTGAAITAW